ncbi:MAG: MBL fold metallo-hydrolase [Ruminococcus sp.]|jgi:glyoxylase-like metal-dependent hydrolase (beta-lactamase superfamily II)|nr:MBL fold metallo-hydrolase [Ruminococcus sp.]
MCLKVTKLCDDLWSIDEAFVRCFLLHGENGTLLIDACMTGGKSFHEKLSEIAGDSEVTMTVTHTDRDHIGGFGKGDTVYIHPAEYEHLGKHDFTVKPLWDGDILPAGNRKLRVMLLPGHTPGNVAFIDDENKMIFSGDSVSESDVYMFGAGRNLESYIASLKRLSESFPGYGFYACHGKAELPPAALTAELECAIKIQNGELSGGKPKFPAPCKLYSYGGAGILFK